MKKKSPMLEAYGITEEEAKEVEKVVEELAMKLGRRDKVIKELKRRFRDGKLLYAIGYAEYCAGYGHAMEKYNIQVSEDRNS